MAKRYIDKQYLEEDYLWDGQTINGEDLFTDNEINKLIQKSSERIASIVQSTIGRYDKIESLSPRAQEAIKLATAQLFDSYSMNGENYTQIIKNINTGSININQQAGDWLKDIPQEVLDGLKAESLWGITISESTQSALDAVFSSKLNSEEFVYQLNLIKAASEELAEGKIYDIATINKILELINDITAGSLAFDTGEILSDVKLEGDELDLFIYKKDKVNELLQLLQTQINSKADIEDVVSVSTYNTGQANQDTFITANGTLANQNKEGLKQVNSVIGAGGTVSITLNVPIDVEVNDVPTKLDAEITFDSARPHLFTWRQGIDYKIAVVLANGRLTFPINLKVKKGNTPSATTGVFELLDDETDEVLASESQEFEFGANDGVLLATGILQYDIETITPSTPERVFSIRAYIEEQGQTLIMAAGSSTVAVLETNVGTGIIADTDDVLNISLQEGATVTEAFDSNKVTVDEHTGLITDLGNDKANKDEAFTTVENYFDSSEDNIGIRKRNINPTEEDINGIHSMELAVTKPGSAFNLRAVVLDSSGSPVDNPTLGDDTIMTRKNVEDAKQIITNVAEATDPLVLYLLED